MAEDLVAFVKEMDQCWMEKRFDDLAGYLAADIVMVAPDGKTRMEGLAASIASYRDFMARCRVHAFDTHDHQVTRRGDAAVLEYTWEMAWDDRGTSHEDLGREILVLVRRGGAWRAVWRTQLPAAR